MNNLTDMGTKQKPNDLSDTRRYELKYTITESLASEIRDYIKTICTLDKHVPPGKTGYMVNNLYFDTFDLRFYHDTKFRKLTRYKPRARYYGEKVGGYIWPEIKYRKASIIWKQRHCIPVEEWPGLFSPEGNEHNTPRFKENFDSFQDVVYWHSAEPMLHVQYFREPYVTELETYGRVTFDRSLCCRPTHGSIDLDYNEADMRYFDDPVSSLCEDSPVILEIKVETLVPVWAIELIRTFNLMQRAYSKYCYGMDCMMNYNDNGRIASLQM